MVHGRRSSSGPAGFAVMNGLNATATTSATAIVTIVAPVIASLRPIESPGSSQVSRAPGRDDAEPEEAVELAEQRQARPATRRTRAGREPQRASPRTQMRAHMQEPDRQRRQHERLARNVRHRPMRVQGIKRVEHEQAGGDRAHARILDDHAARKESETAERTQRDDGQPRGHERRGRPPNDAVVAAYQFRASAGPGIGKWARRNASPIKYLGRG